MDSSDNINTHTYQQAYSHFYELITRI